MRLVNSKYNLKIEFEENKIKNKLKKGDEIEFI